MATSFLLRKSLTIPGAITLTGNTLGLVDKDYPYRFPWNNGNIFFPITNLTFVGNDIGAFITTDTSKQVSGYPQGTTKNWAENNSAAILKLPQGAKVVYAELVWGGATRGSGSNTTSPVNLDSQINTPVRFTAPDGRVYNISPDPATSATTKVAHTNVATDGRAYPYIGGDQLYYVRSQNVTNIVNQYGPGQYQCGGVVANIIHFAPFLTRCAGWDLIVLYELPTLPVRNLTFFLGIDAVGGDGAVQIEYQNGQTQNSILPAELKGPRDINITGFVTPQNGPVNTRIILSGMQGDPLVTYSGTNLGIGDKIAFGPNTSSLQQLSGPNNRLDNFLAGQINDDNGILDTTGTFGSLNENPNNQPVGSIKRASWDITNLNGSGILQNSERSAIVQINSVKDEYALHLLALQIDVNAPNIQTQKYVDKQTANVGDTITYTVVIKNTGSTSATNMVFRDTVPNGASFIPGSVTVNGVSNANAIPNTPGFTIPNLGQNEVTTITFNVKINVLPSPNPMINQADVTFNYQQAPDFPVQSGTSSSNQVNTLVDVAPQPNLTSIKTVDKTSAVVGDIITYSVTYINTGNVQLNNLVFLDTLPTGTTLVPDSVIVDNNPIAGLNPQNGIPLSNLPVASIHEIVWQVQINTVPSPNPILNTGYLGFNYFAKDGATVPGINLTNTVNTNVAIAKPGLQVIKNVNLNRAAVGQEVIYTTTFKNTGNVPLTGVIFKDILENGLTYVAGTLTVGGVSVSGDPTIGIPIGTVPVGATAIVEFRALINTIPSLNPVPNASHIDYQFSPGPGQSPLTGGVDSNIVFVDVFEGINPVLQLNKQVDKTVANIGDIIIYTIGVTNPGNVDLTNIVIKDTIPAGTQYVQDSLQLNFATVPNGNIETGINILALPQQGVAIISYQVVVTQLPIPNPIPNVANGTANYRDVNGQTQTTAVTSNQVNTLVVIPIPQGTIAKSVDKTKAIVGEFLTYTVRITNTGSVDFNNSLFRDTIPNGTSFVQGSVTVNGIANITANPGTGFSLGTIPIGQIAVVQYRVRIDTLPNPNPIPNSATTTFQYTTNASNPNSNSSSLNSNVVNTEVVTVRMNIQKLADKTSANIGDTITYTILINNPSSVDINNVVLSDTIPNGTTFVNNSVTVNGASRSGSPQSGISIGTLLAQTTQTITFQVVVTANPNPNPIPNIATTTYTYKPDPTSNAEFPGTDISNTNTIPVGPVGTGSASITKSVDKTTANIGDTLTYTLVVKNTGTLDLENVNVQDTIPNGTSFNTGSLTINGVTNLTANPQSGVNIGNLSVGGVTTVVFTVQITGTPIPNPIPNNATTTFQYTPIGGTLQNGGANSNQVTTLVQGSPGTASMNINKIVDKSTANVGDSLTYTLVVSNTGGLALNNINITDTIPNGGQFIPSTVNVNGVNQPSANPQSGIALGTLNVGQVSTITFQVILSTLPNPNPMVNSATGTYQYTPQGGTPQSGGTNSNQVPTQVNPTPQGNLTLLKNVDKQTASVGDTLTYTILATNTGNSPILSANIFDTIPNGGTFVTGSVTISGVSVPGVSPQTGIPTGPLSVGQSVIITFNVLIENTPNPNPMPNTASSNFVYQPSGGTPQNGTSTSNTVTTQVQTNPSSPGLNLFKYADKQTATVGDTVTYTFVAQNTGNLLLSNVVIKDTIPNGTTFNQGSVSINGVNNPTAAPQPNGINVGNISVGSSSTVIFTVTITSLPNPNPMVNIGNASYQYTPPGGNPQNGSTNSNPTSTLVNQVPGRPNIISSKQADKQSAIVGDTISYTITISNTGTLAADNVTIIDQIPNGTSFVQGSVAIDNISQPGSNPQTGVNIGTVAINSSRTVTFKVVITTIPNPNPVSNVANVNYQYTPPGGNTQSGTTTTPPATTTVYTNTPIQSATKSVDKAYSDVGDILTYTITVNNTSTLNVTNLTITDTIPNGTSFVSNSVTINGNQIIGSDPQSGVFVGNLPAGSLVVVAYKVKVITLPNPNPIPNVANISYNFKPTPTSPDNSAQLTSNQVTTQVNTVVITPSTPAGMFKSADKGYANVGDTITYTVSIKNNGNTTASNVVFRDTIPEGTLFAQNTVFVNGVAVTGNPSSGIGIGNIGPNQTTTVIFQVRVLTIPNPNPILNSADISFTYSPNPQGPPVGSGSSSNIVPTTVSNGNIPPVDGIFKRVDKEYAAIGEVLTYTVTLKNTGNSPVNNVIFNDQIPNGTTFVNNSVTIDSVAQPGANPQNGVLVGTINPLEVKIITFQVKVATVPNPNPIPNYGSVDYSYIVNPNQPPVTSSSTSNTVTTQVNKATINTNDGGLVKSVDKAFAKIGDIITYTVKLTNTGNTVANNVILLDTVPNDTSFILGSVTINGTPSPGSDPNSGVFVGSIAPNQTVFVVFKVKIDRVPNPNPLPNLARIRYSYTVDPTRPNSEIESHNSNTVFTQVNDANIQNSDGGLIKAADKETASIGDIINYTVTLRNTGNVTANNINFVDNIPNGTSFVQNSFTVNNVPIASANPQNGVNIGFLAPNQTAVVRFSIRVNTLPNPNPIPNTAVVDYSFLVDPTTGTTASESNQSNTINTLVNQAIINPANGDLVKEVNKATANVGDIISYTIRVRNSGNTDAINTVFRDTIPNDTNFILGSVTVDNVPVSSANPQSGISLGTIRPNQIVTIKFSIQILRLPNPNPISNLGNIDFSYISNPNTGQTINSSSTSNPVTTLVSFAEISNTAGGFNKLVDKTFAKILDTLTYTINATNTGNTNANNAVILDTIPSGTMFIVNSVTVNGVSRPGVNPASGVNVGTIAPNQTVQVIYQVVVVSIPAVNPIPNRGNISYTYTSDPINPNGNSVTNTTNQVTTQINTANISTQSGGLSKKVDKEFAKIGEEITYTINLKNTGNVTANNVVFLDTIPSGTTFIQNSLTLNGNIISNANPSNGVNIGSIPPNGSAIIAFRVLVSSNPITNPIPNKSVVSYGYIVNPNTGEQANTENSSNTVLTTVNTAGFGPSVNGSIIKTVDKTIASVGEQITYTVTLRNGGNTTANNVFFVDIIPSGTSFVPGSVSINGSQTSANSPSDGIPLGNLPGGSSTVVRFKVKVDTIPQINPVPNTASVSYKYTLNPNSPDSESGKDISNTVFTKINTANLTPGTGSNFKSVNKSFADIGDDLLYTISFRNTGNVEAVNVVLFDTIPNGTTFVSDSVTINGTPRFGVNPQNGISIGTVLPNQTVTVVFKVITNTVLNPNVVKNSALLSYNYTADPTSPPINVIKPTNETDTVLNSAIINSESGGLSKTVDKAYAAIGDTLTYTVAVKNNGNVLAENVILLDTVPDFTRFISNSVLIDGVPKAGLSPQNGISLGAIPANSSVVVVFKVLVTSIPPAGAIENRSVINYSYVVNPNTGIPTNVTNISNTASTQVNAPSIGLNKTISQNFGDIGNVITYTIAIKNSGNTVANNVIIKDTLPNGLLFMANSVTINGQQQPNVVPSNGISIGNIAPNETITVSFKSTIVSIPNPNVITNTVQLGYSYRPDPNSNIPVGFAVISNPASITINSGSINPQIGGFTKSVDKSFATVGETITYTIFVKNTGNVPITNVIVRDTIPTGTEFVSDSVNINQSRIPGTNPITGINLDTLDPGESATISYMVKITTVPNPNPIPNIATATYNYTVNPSIPNGASSTVSTNNVETQVNFASISSGNNGLIKSVNKPYADVGEKLTYTIFIRNSGNTTATNVIINDTIPNGTTFVENSVTLNGNIINSSNPQNGIPIGTVGPGQSSTITFQVVVNTIPRSNPIANNANISYNFTKNPAIPNGETAVNTSNTITTTISNGTVAPGGFIKSVDKQFVKLGDIISYAFSISNSGNVPITNVIVKDVLPSETQYVPNSATIDGISISNVDPNTGINIGTINAKQTRILTLQVKVVSLPSNNPIINNGVLNYQYIVDPTKPPVNQVVDSNTVPVNVNSADISGDGLIKQVDKSFAQLGDILTYSIVLKNTGNTTANNIIVTDTLPSGVEFIPSSVVVNGVSKPTINPATGISILTIFPNETAVVKFKVKVVSIPPSSKIVNTSTVTYDFIVDPNKQPVTESNTTKPITTVVNSVDFSGNNFTKKADPEFAKIGDIVTYTFVIRNAGSITANSVLFKDTLPSAVSFIDNSVTLNSIPLSGVNPEEGISLGSIAPNKVFTLTFKVRIDTIPSPNPLKNTGVLNYQSLINPSGPPVNGTSVSNSEEIQVNTVNLSIAKTSNPNMAVVGDIVTYIVAVNNTGNVTAENVVVSDPLSPQLEFISNSISVNGVSIPLANIISGVDVGNIKPHKVVTVTFTAKILKNSADGIIKNTATASYNYQVDPTKPNVQGSDTSNENKLPTEIAQIHISKNADLSAVMLGDIITYSVDVENVGTVDATSIRFFDILSNELKLVPNSFTLNSIPINGVNLTTGINIGALKPQQVAKISYKATVIKVCCGGLVENKAFANFDYKLSNMTKTTVQKSNIATVAIKATSPNFKQLNIDTMVKIPDCIEGIKEINDVIASIDVISSYVVKTIVATSSENRKLTGYKLVINGCINQTIEYTANCESQKNYSFENISKFSTFIILPDDYEPGTLFDVISNMEDIHHRLVCHRSLFLNFVFTLDAIIRC